MKKYSLRKSLYRIFVGSVIIPFVLISMMVSGFFHNQSINSYKENNEIILQSIISHMSSTLRSTEQFFYQYVFDADISNFYRYINNNDIDDSEEKLYKYFRYSSKYRSAINNYLTIFNTYVRGIGFIPENEREINCFYLKKYSDDIIQYQMDEAILQDFRKLSLRDRMFLPDSIMLDYQSEPVFTMIRVNNHLDSATRQGYVFLEVSETLFSDLICQVSLPKGGGVTIYYPNGTAAYTTEEQFIFDDSILADMHNVSRKSVKIEGKKYYAYSMQEEEYGFLVCYLLPQSVILGRAMASSFVIICIWCCAILVSFFIYGRLSERISVSTERIITYIRRYQLEDKTDNRLLLSRMPIDEFDAISKSLLDMTDRIRTLVQFEYNMKMSQQIAEYKAMQAEINPHFFYNVMNSLLALNRIGDTKKLECGILNLSRMFRYTCEHDYESTVLQECDLIESYLMLEKVRFEERLNYRIYVEKSIENFPIPKLLLQPIVENAMHHGMPQDGSELTIIVNAFSVRGRDGKNFLWIAVANDGIPYIKEEIFGHNRVGITNVRERLNISYPNSFFWYDRREIFQTICNILICIE